ncbi:RagB/SusD family nutrient uptake outer membrane protein [uncultured Arcticibacterium sp.]|uniref:RagB/SusD family nutrient uptake outer membrane protein n=1 Tax=uncultured Arcticibacterium sp. TaxID=2173042 RepID=UPI0030FCDC9E
MKINYISKIFVLSLACFSLTSCEDFLTEENKSNVTAESYYITSAGFESLLNANYSQLREIYGGDPWLFAAGTDLYAEGRSQEPVGLSQYRDLNPSSSGVDQLYNTCYRAIQLANQAIHYSGITEQSSSISTSVGEVKFLRALAYFNLVQTYGGVALVKDYINEPVLEFDRNSAEEVYSFIISDLEEALNLVSSGAYNGRVNKRAVQHLLGKVYLTRGYEDYGSSSDFSTAAAMLDQAIGGQGLDIPYSELWRPENDGNAETIFSVQYSAGSISADPLRLGNSQARYFGPYLGGSEVAGDAPQRSYNLCPTDYALGLFTQDDARWDASFMVTVYNRYFDEFDVDDKSGLGVFHYYAPAWITEADSIAFVTKYPNATYHPYGTYSSQTVSLDYETIPLKKFDDPKASFGGRSSTRDVVLARLGDTYLLAAEAYLKSGDASTGLARLNVVRNRAGVSDATPGEFDIDYILDERGRELLGEYHRWFDLKRTGKLVERASAYHRLVSEADFAGANGELKILRPIPQSAIDLNQNRSFQQNPAYE